MSKKLSSQLDKPKIVLILGYPRSGSTVFGELINQLNDFIHVGEMERLWWPKKNKASLYPQKECSCGARLCECDFWLPYFKETAEEIRAINDEEQFEVNSKVLCSYKEDFIQKGKINSKESEIYTRVISKLYYELYRGENKIILDTSKELWYARYLESTGLFDVSYIHLIRDVRGIVYSRQKKLRKLNEKTGKVSLNYKYLFHDTLRWNYINQKIKKFLINKESIEVRYEDFIKNPKLVLKEILTMCNMKITLKHFDFINDENEFFIKENHLVHGNRFRFVRGKVALKKDTRWIDELTKKDDWLIRNFSWVKFQKREIG